MIEIIRGDDVTLQVTFTDSDGAVIDLTGSTVFSHNNLKTYNQFEGRNKQ